MIWTLPESALANWTSVVAYFISEGRWWNLSFDSPRHNVADSNSHFWRCLLGPLAIVIFIDLVLFSSIIYTSFHRPGRHILYAPIAPALVKVTSCTYRKPSSSSYRKAGVRVKPESNRKYPSLIHVSACKGSNNEFTSSSEAGKYALT